MYPSKFDYVNQLDGSAFGQFVRQSIIEHRDVYSYDEKQKIISKIYQDGYREPTDFPTYVTHFYNLKHKTNSVDECRLVFADLSSEQILISFLASTPPQRRLQLEEEVRLGCLFETANWLRTYQKQGCVKCASYLQRQMLP